MRWLKMGSSCVKPATCVYRARPNRYKTRSANVQTIKLATARGMRSFNNGGSKGSSKNAMVTAITMVMKNTRPKYSNATIAATDKMVKAAGVCLGTGTTGVEAGVGVRVDIRTPGLLEGTFFSKGDLLL